MPWLGLGLVHPRGAPSDSNPNACTLVCMSVLFLLKRSAVTCVRRVCMYMTARSPHASILTRGPWLLDARTHTRARTHSWHMLTARCSGC